MWIYVSWAMILPITIILIYKIYKHSIIIHKNTKYINMDEVVVDWENYTKLELEQVKPDYRIPRGQVAHFAFDIPNLRMGSKTRKYTGNTKSGIKFPLMNLSFQNREFHDIHEYKDWGTAKVTLTNKLTRVICQDDKPLRREVNHIDVEEIRFVEDNRTVHISTKKSTWPLRLQFKDHEDALQYLNAFWTLLFEYTSASPKVGVLVDKEKVLKSLTVYDLRSLAESIFEPEEIFGLKKNELVKLLNESKKIDDNGYLVKGVNDEQSNKSKAKK